MEVIIDNKKINYEVVGKGQPVIVLHGWLASLDVMKPLVNNLSKNFKVYNVDILGFGKSDLPDVPLYTDDFGNFLNNFITLLKIENPILIGHSNGGKTIINYAGRNLGSIRKIILLDSTGIKPKKKFSVIIRIKLYKMCKKILKLIPVYGERLVDKISNKFGSDDYKLSPAVLKKTMSNILNEGQENILPNIKCPTLLIWGEKDTATPISDAYKISELIPDSGVAVIPEGTHFAFLDNLYLTNKIINEFLKDDIGGK